MHRLRMERRPHRRPLDQEFESSDTTATSRWVTATASMEESAAVTVTARGTRRCRESTVARAATTGSASPSDLSFWLRLSDEKILNTCT